MCKAVDIDNIDCEILDIIQVVKATLNFTDGFGIAVPEVGIDKRIIIIQVDKQKCSYKNCEDVPTTIMINPIWKNISEDKDIEFEGCLSVPSIRGKVERYINIEVNYYNEKGKKVTQQFSEFTARDIQHECDHLDGITFLQKVDASNGFATKDMINKFKLKEL